MTATSNDQGSGSKFTGANPFAPTAVASVAALDTNTVTVLTPAIRAASGFLDAYLAETSETSGGGNVIAVVGDYGTGKTHLAVELLRHARQNTDKNAHAIYIDARAASFVSLYRRFVEELKEADVVRQVREYYTAVVREDLGSSELTARIAERLRDDDDTDPHSVVARLELDEVSLLREVQRRLEAVTRNEAFAAALTLMLRPGFQGAVWSWLCGDPPARILVERGITTAIDNDQDALEAMGVFAVLYGHHNHRFVLVIDEVEKVLSGPHGLVDTVLAAFKKLLTVFAGARAFLVLVGLPDFLLTLGSDVQNRLSRVVHMSALTVDDARQFIIASQRQLSPEAGLEPFTAESVDYLIHLTEGAPRKVIRLCYHSYRRAVEEDKLVTPAMIREAARTHTNILSISDIRARVRMILGREGWEHSANHMLDSSTLTRLDEWIYIGDRGGGCGIIVTDPVLDEEDIERLNERALAIQSAAPGTRTLLIVNGYIAQDSAARLGEVFNMPPLAYDPRSFDDDIIGLVKAMTASVRQGAEDQTIKGVQERVERINRQQSSIYRFIEQLAVHLDAMRSSSDRRLDLLQGELAGITQSLREGPVTGESVLDSESVPSIRLPGEVLRLFGDAFDSLADVDRVDGVLRHAFAVGSGRSSQVSATSMEIRAALRSQRAVNSLGVAVMLQKLVEAFRAGLNEWYRSYARDPQGELLSSHKEQLEELCNTYDSIYEYLPLFQLKGLTDLTSIPAGTESQEVAQVTRFSRGADVGETLDGLGARVRKTMLDAVTSVDRS